MSEERQHHSTEKAGDENITELPLPSANISPKESPSGNSMEEKQWQRRLLPLMAGMVVALTIFFFAASLFQLYSVQNAIEKSPTIELDAILSQMSPTEDAKKNKAVLEFGRWKTLVELESHTLERRYHQANVLLMARIWVRYLGFVTGMILAMIGAVFVLGKMKEERTTIKANTNGGAAALSTTSPGLILVSLGTVMMLTTILTHHQIDVRDGPLYTSLPYAKIASEQNALPPEDVENLGMSKGEKNKGDPSIAEPKSEADNQSLENLLKEFSPEVSTQ